MLPCVTSSALDLLFQIDLEEFTQCFSPRFEVSGTVQDLQLNRYLTCRSTRHTYYARVWSKCLIRHAFVAANCNALPKDRPLNRVLPQAYRTRRLCGYYLLYTTYVPTRSTRLPRITKQHLPPGHPIYRPCTSSAKQRHLERHVRRPQ